MGFPLIIIIFVLFLYLYFVFVLFCILYFPGGIKMQWRGEAQALVPALVFPGTE